VIEEVLDGFTSWLVRVKKMLLLTCKMCVLQFLLAPWNGSTPVDVESHSEGQDTYLIFVQKKPRV